MYQRHVCPSMGAVRRAVFPDVAASAQCLSRTFHSSVRRLEDSSSSAPSSGPAPNKAPRETRRTRNSNAFQQLAGLRPPRTPRAAGSEASASDDAKLAFRKYIPRTPNAAPAASGSAAPPGTMARAPATLRITRKPVGRNTAPGAPESAFRRGPNLHGRDRSARRPGGPDNGEKRPRPRGDKKQSSGAGKKAGAIKIQDSLSNAMVKHLHRLQRQEWDRVQYEPKYAHGSEAAKELIQKGKSLFAGEVPTVKSWGRLEKRLRITDMHGAETRVPKYPDEAAR